MVAIVCQVPLPSPFVRIPLYYLFRYLGSRFPMQPAFSPAALRSPCACRSAMALRLPFFLGFFANQASLLTNVHFSSGCSYDSVFGCGRCVAEVQVRRCTSVNQLITPSRLRVPIVRFGVVITARFPHTHREINPSSPREPCIFVCGVRFDTGTWVFVFILFG